MLLNLLLAVAFGIVYLDVNSEETNGILPFWKRSHSDDENPRKFHFRNDNMTKYMKNQTKMKKMALKKHLAKSKKWPKVKLNYKPRASTRMYNQTNEETTQNNSYINPYEKRTTLNAYDLRNHLTSILEHYPNVFVVDEVIGRTVGYNDIVLLKITESSDYSKRFRIRSEDKYVIDASEKKIIFIVHGLTTMGLRLIPCLYEEKRFQELLSIYLAHIKIYDIYIIPIANPDGYIYGSIRWGKNRSPQEECEGVSLDRNFDIAWKNHTINSCSQIYPGPTPFSEKESKAVRSVVHKYGNKIIAYINVHAATSDNSVYKGDAVLYPKGYTDVESDEDKYLDLKGEIEEAITNASFKMLNVHMETLHNWYGKVTGTSVDYASKVYSIPFAMEFLMQPYNTNFQDTEYVDTYEHTALLYVWKTIIDATFDFIHKTAILNAQD